MDNQRTHRSGYNRHDMSSTALVHSRPEQTRYTPIPDPTVVSFPPSLSDILLENRLTQMATVDQQRELMQYSRRLNEWMGREVGERHDDLRRLRASFGQMVRDVRDLQDEEEESNSSTSGEGSETFVRPDLPPQQFPGMSTNQPYPVPRPVIPPTIPNQQPQHVFVVLPSVYAPRPIHAAPRQARQLLPPPQQPAARLTPGPPPFIPPDSSDSSARPLRSNTSGHFPVSARPHNGSNVVIISESSLSSPRYGTPGNQSLIGQRGSNNQPFPTHSRWSMGSDVTFVPLSTSSTRSSTPARGNTNRLAPRGSVTSLRGRGILRRTPSGISQRSPLVITNSSSPEPVGQGHWGPVLPTSGHPPLVRPASQPNAARQQPAYPQPVLRPPLLPSPAAVMSTSGPGRNYGAGIPISRPPPGPMPDMSFAPARAASLRVARGPQVPVHPPAIRQRSPVPRHNRGRTPHRATQPVIHMKTSPVRLSKRRRPQPTTTVPRPVVYPSQPIASAPPPQPEVILMPARNEAIRNHQSQRQLRPIDTSVFVPPAAVTAVTYPGSHVRTTVRHSLSPLIIPQHSPVSSNSFIEHPAVIRKTPSSRLRPQPIPIQPTQPVVRKASPSRLTKRRIPEPVRVVEAPQPIGRVSRPPQPEVVLMPAQTDSIRRHQSHRQLRSGDTSTVGPTSTVTAMIYPETVTHGRSTSLRPPTPFIVPQRSPVSSNESSRSSAEAAERLWRSPSRSSSRHGPGSAQPVLMKRSPSRLTKRRPQPAMADPPVVHPSPPIRTASSTPQPEVVVIPPRTEPMQNRQSRRLIRPINTSTNITTPAVTAMTFPETDTHVRTTAQRPPTPYIPQRSPVSRDGNSGNSRSSMQVAEQPAVLRKTQSRPSIRREPQPTNAIAIPVVPPSQPIGNILSPSGPEIVLMPARNESVHGRGRGRNRSADSSPVVLSAESESEPSQTAAAQGSNDVTESRSHSSVPPSGAVVVPLDSEAEEVMGMRRPTLERRASFSERDWVNYGSRSSSTDSHRPRSRSRGYYQDRRSYSSDDSGNRPITPSVRGRSRSPRLQLPVGPTSGWPRSPSRIYRSASTEMWDRKSRSRSKRGRYQRRSTSRPTSIYDNSLLLPPVGYGRDVSGIGSRPNSRLKRQQGSWLHWMDNL